MSDESLGFDPPSLIKFLRESFAPKWTPDDQKAALIHQLKAPLSPDLTSSSEPGAIELNQYLEGRQGPKTFESQLLAMEPSLKVLQAIKVFAKRIQTDGQNPLAGDPASVLYFGAIAAALLQCGVRITNSSNTQLRQGFQWAYHYPGAETLKSLFASVIDLVP